MKCPNFRPWSSSHAYATSGDSGAGPYSKVLKTEATVVFAGFAEDAMREYFGPVDFELPLELEAPPFDATFCFFAVGAGVEELFFFGMAVQISVSGNRSALFVVDGGTSAGGRDVPRRSLLSSLAHKIAIINNNNNTQE